MCYVTYSKSWIILIRKLETSKIYLAIYFQIYLAFKKKWTPTRYIFTHCRCQHHHQHQIPHKTEAVCHPRLGQAPHTCLSGHPDDKEHWSTFFSQSWTKDATLVVPIFYPPLQILPCDVTIQFELTF